MRTDDRPAWTRVVATATTVSLLVVGGLRTAAATAVDPFTVTADQVDRRLGLATCLLHAGQWEPDRPDAGRFPAAVIGNPAPGGGRWLDIRRAEVILPIMADRLDLCRAKGLHRVRFDGLDGDRHGTGFDLTADDEAAFAAALDRLAAAHGLGDGPVDLGI